MDKYEKVNLRIDEIVAEIQRLGRWNSGSLSPEKLENMGPFGMNTMPLEEWIQFVLVPRVQEIVEKKGEFPQSSISTYAVKYFDGDLDGQRLLQLIVEFDQIVNE
ncbi:MAG: YqcC family protein [Candidatus Gracilibacteria bacterium]